MNRANTGIARARRMRAWKDRKGGLPPTPDPFLSGKAGAYDDAALAWLEALRLRNLSPATIDAYRRALIGYRRWLLGSNKGSFQSLANLLSAKRVIRFQQSLIEQKRTPASRAYYLANLKRFSNWLTAQGRLSQDPLLQLEPPKLPRHHLPKYLSISRVEHLLELPDPIGIRDRAILEVLYSTGLRRTELTQIALQDLDFHRCQIRVCRGKGGKPRLVPAGSRAFNWIREYLREARPQLADASEPDSRLFVTGYGDGFSPGGLGHLVRHYLDLAGLEHPGACHLFRHSCATHLLDGGAGLRAIQRILGHSRLDLTAIYTHVSNRRLLEVHAQCHPHGDQANHKAAEASHGQPASPRTTNTGGSGVKSSQKAGYRHPVSKT